MNESGDSVTISENKEKQCRIEIVQQEFARRRKVLKYLFENF